MISSSCSRQKLCEKCLCLVGCVKQKEKSIRGRSGDEQDGEHLSNKAISSREVHSTDHVPLTPKLARYVGQRSPRASSEEIHRCAHTVVSSRCDAFWEAI